VKDMTELFYLCGYALEIALKVKAGKIKGYSDFPETAVEFKNYKREKLKTHNLNSLLTLSGLDLKSDRNQFKRFNIVAANWGPEYRYRKILGKMNEAIAVEMIEATEKLLPIILC
jgi:hypothetical protein